MPITAELKRVYASAPVDTRYVETLALWHSTWDRVHYITNDVQAWIFALENGALVEFRVIPFLVVLPTQDGKGQQDLAITIENIGREIMDYIELASTRPSEPIAVTYRVYLDRPNSAPQNDPPLALTVSSLVVGLDAITGTATRADTLNRQFPSVLYRLDTYPGLDR